ncbi:hypothetical protein BZA77DRAFT_360724 [Pyronema omphalodes]|nr:hypothetical protein BZA77DRAFT_360724 [Pyronema omphalodes]
MPIRSRSSTNRTDSPPILPFSYARNPADNSTIRSNSSSNSSNNTTTISSLNPQSTSSPSSSPVRLTQYTPASSLGQRSSYTSSYSQPSSIRKAPSITPSRLSRYTPSVSSQYDPDSPSRPAYGFQQIVYPTLVHHHEVDPETQPTWGLFFFVVVVACGISWGAWFAGFKIWGMWAT